MEPIIKVIGRGLPLTIDDIDTDRIIPSRFLRCVTFDGIGDHLFYDERYDESGKKTNFPLNSFLYEGAEILISGKNFGCGSSREHAPQAIKRAGYKAIIAESFAEIFFGNSITIGLPCVTMSKNDISRICRHIAEEPRNEIVIDLVQKVVTCHGETYYCSIPAIPREALLKGTYDLLSELLKNKSKIEEVNLSLPY